MQIFLSKRLILVLLSFWIGVEGCTQTVTNVTLPYEEKIVIEGLLVAGKPLANILITRVQPPLEKISDKAAYLSNAEITIMVDNQAYTPTVRFDSVRVNSYYGYSSSGGVPTAFLPSYSVPNLIVQAGKTYEISVRWNGKTAQAKAVVPSAESSLLGRNFVTSISSDSVPIYYGSVYSGGISTPLTLNVPRIVVSLETSVHLRPGLTQQLLLYAKDTATVSNGVRDTVIIASGGFETIGAQGTSTTRSSFVSLPENSQEKTIQMRVSAWRAVDFQYRTSGYSSVPVITGTLAELRQRLRGASWYAGLVITQTSYFEWVSTLSSAQGYGGGSPFSSGGTNPVWNVTGDGIGFFAGTSGLEVPIQIQW